MIRKFKPFEAEAIRKEFLSISGEDAYHLKYAMESYQEDYRIGYTVKNYGDGLMMVKDSGRSQGRCLFFFSEIVDGIEILTVVLIYKKETQEAPKHIIETARKRMEESK